jgi:hypothetical protein
MRYLIIITLLAGCANKTCQSLKTVDYSDSFQAKLEAELEAAKAAVVWPYAIEDYRNLRQRVKTVCDN